MKGSSKRSYLTVGDMGMLRCWILFRHPIIGPHVDFLRSVPLRLILPLRSLYTTSAPRPPPLLGSVLLRIGPTVMLTAYTESQGTVWTGAIMLISVIRVSRVHLVRAQIGLFVGYHLAHDASRFFWHALSRFDSQVFVQ